MAILLRISSVVLVVFAFFLFFKLLSKRSFKGSGFILCGILCIAVSWVLGFALHIQILPKEVYSKLPPDFSSAASWVVLTCGLGFLLTGIFSLYKSLVPQMDEYYSSLVEHSLVGVYLIQDSRFKYVNSRFAEILGRVREEMIGTPVLHIVADKDRKKVKTNIKKCLHAEVSSINHDFTAMKATGEMAEVEIFGNFTMHDGRPAIHGMVLDVSARKQALEIILAGEERFRSLANSMFDLIAETDPEGTILYLSTNIKEILGYESYELLNTSIFKLLHPEDLTHTMAEFRRSLQDRKSGRALYRCKRKKGDWQWMEATVKPYISGSGEARVIHVARDVTERMKKEEEVFKESKLESIGILAGGIAHDFNNILTAILGNVSLAKSYLESNEIEPLQILSDAEKACGKARELTAQFLTFAKGGEPIKKSLNIKYLLKDAIELGLRGSRIENKFTYDDNLWMVNADSVQLGQAFQNLMINAVQAMPYGGRIKVHVENKSMGENTPGLEENDYVKIMFADEGVGVREEHLSKIFDPYFTTKETASGLGLSTVYSIIKNHKGLIKVESKLGTGTTFTIYMPANSEEKTTRRRISNRTGLSQYEGRILIMDDEETVRNIASRILGRFGFEVEVAEDGAKAIRLYQNARENKKPFDALLIDLTIPGGMGGKETIKSLLKIDPSVKAIVSSGYSNDPIMSDYRSYGFKGVLAKPYRFDSLGRVISEIIESESDSEPELHSEPQPVKRFDSTRSKV